MLRLIEHYPSIQGEGPRTGVPTQFVRFAGCNLRCPGWPCDTQFAIQPKLFTKEQVLISPTNLSHTIQMMALNNGVFNVCFTGGEPMLQSTDDLEELIEYLQATGLFMSLEMFSNGTIPYSDEIVRNCHIIMDWKLPGSGEQTASTTRAHNYKRMDECGGHTIKFTCKHEGDLRAALELHEAMCMDQWTGDIYVGPVWDSELPPRRIVEFVLEHKLPWNLNIQVHKYVWKPDARRT